MNWAQANCLGYSEHSDAWYIDFIQLENFTWESGLNIMYLRDKLWDVNTHSCLNLNDSQMKLNG